MANPISFLVSAIISTAISIVVSRALAPDSDSKDVGADITKNGVQNPRNRVFGRCRASCTNIYSNVKNSDYEIRLDVFAIAGIGRVKKIHQAWINDKPMLLVTDIVSDPTSPTSGTYSGNNLEERFRKQAVQVQFRNGDENEVAMQLARDNSDGELDSNFRGARVPKVAVRCKRVIDEDGVVITSENYSISVEVTGEDCYDPRTGGKSSSSNPVLALLEVLNDDYYGMDIPYSYIDLESFKAAANWCDANKLTINGEINCNQSYSKILTRIIACFDGALIIENGLIKVVYEDIESPIYHVTEDDYLTNSFKITEQSSSNYYNVVNVNYKSSVNDEKEDKFQLPADTTTDPTIKNDGKIKTKTIDMPLVIDGTRTNAAGDTVVDGPVRFLARRMLRKAKFQKQVKLDLDLIEFPLLTINSVIQVSNSAHGWDKREFRVSNISNSVEDEKLSVATVTLDEYSDEVYTSIDEGVGSKPQPKPPVDIKAPTNVTFTQDTFVTSGYGTLSWDNQYFGLANEYHVDAKLSSETAWTRYGEVKREFFKFSNLKDDTYDFRVRVFDPIGGTSNWTELKNVVINIDVQLPSVTNVAIDAASSKDFVVTWDDMTPKPIGGLDATNPDSGGDGGTVGDRFSYYRVDVKHGSNTNPVVETFYPTDNRLVYTYEQNKTNGLNRTVSVDVYIVTKSGQQSQKGNGFATAKNNQIDSSSGSVVLRGGISNFAATWAARTEPDFKASRVHVSTTADFTPDDSNLVSDSPANAIIYTVLDADKGKLHYIKVGHYDDFGLSEINYTPQQSLLPPTLDDFLPEFPDELSDIRDPNLSQTQTGEYIFNVASADKKKVAGMGLYAKDTGTTKAIIAADEFVISAGGHAEYEASTAYVTGDRVTVTKSDVVQQLWEAKTSVPTGNAPPTTGSEDTYWIKRLDNTYQSAFYFDSVKEKMVVRNAMIEDLTTDNLQAGGVNADRLVANSVTGGEISSETTITAGNPVTAGMNGFDDGTGYNVDEVRFWAGADESSARTAPFKVDKDGRVDASNMNITGGGLNINNRFIVDNTGQTTISTASTGSRLVLSGDRLEVYEGSVLRVRIGRL